MIIYATKRLGGISGSSKSANNVANVLSDLNINFELVSEHPFKFFFKGKLVKRLKRIPAVERSSTLAVKYLKMFENTLRQGKIHFGEDEIILVNSYMPGIQDRLRCSGKWINIVRGSPESFKNNNNPFITFEQFVHYLNLFNELVFLSESLLEDWRPHLSDRIECSIIPNTVDDMTPRKKILGYKDQINIVCVGSIQRRKGQDVLLAAAALIKQYTVNITLIGGSEPTYMDEFHEVLEDAQKFSHINVNMTGHVSDPSLYISGEDIFVLPTRAEAMPRSVIEAMAMSLPIITTNVDGNGDLIEDGICGLLVAPNDPSELAQKLVLLHQDKDLRSSLAARARAEFEDKYSWHAYKSNWKKFLRKHKIQ